MNRFALLAGIVAGCALIVTGGSAMGADKTTAKPASGTAGPSTFRVTQLEKLHIRDSGGEKVGSIEDLVVNLESGKVVYAAMGFGGVLGIGEKLFAVPFNHLTLRKDKDNEHYFALDVAKDRLQSAPGFDKNHWPDFADPSFTQPVDNFYRDAGTTNKVGQQ